MPLKTKPINLSPIVIVGAGGLGREVLMLLHQINKVVPQWQVLGFYDDNAHTPKSILDYPYLGTLTDLQETNKSVAVVIAVSNPALKVQIREKLNNPAFIFPPLIHPGVANETFQYNKIGEGCIICQGTILTTNIKLGQQVLLNLNCTIGHDAVIGDFCALMPLTSISGNTILEQQVYVGTHATVLPGVRVRENSIIGAGAVVIQNIPANCTAVGVPARVIKQHAD